MLKTILTKTRLKVSLMLVTKLLNKWELSWQLWALTGTFYFQFRIRIKCSLQRKWKIVFLSLLKLTLYLHSFSNWVFCQMKKKRYLAFALHLNTPNLCRTQLTLSSSLTVLAEYSWLSYCTGLLEMGLVLLLFIRDVMKLVLIYPLLKVNMERYLVDSQL